MGLIMNLFVRATSNNRKRTLRLRRKDSFSKPTISPIAFEKTFSQFIYNNVARKISLIQRFPLYSHVQITKIYFSSFKGLSSAYI